MAYPDRGTPLRSQNASVTPLLPTQLRDTAIGVPSRQSQQLLLELMISIQDHKRLNSELRDRMYAMDRTLRAFEEQRDPDCEEIIKLLNFSLVASQLDTEMAEFTDTYVSGTPMFPVEATPNKRELGSKVERLIDQHARLGHWGHHLMRFGRQLLKYNVACIELDWRGTTSMSAIFDSISDAPSYEPKVEYWNQIFCPDMYNTLWDYRVDPPDVGRRGEWVGYNEVVTRQDLIREMNVLSLENKLFNHQEALGQVDNWNRAYYWEHPTVSKYKTIDTNKGWQSWLTLPSSPDGKGGSGLFFRTTLYVRITPAHFGLQSNAASEIWKMRFVNDKVLYSLEPVVTYNDLLPCYMAQYSDDNIGMRVPSTVEYIAPIQEAATELLNNRIGSSKRSLGDRLLYRTDMVKGKHIKSRNPSARIPVDVSMNPQGLSLSDAVAPIPFSDPNAGTVLQDMRLLTQIGELVTGNNSADEGQFRKGNRTLGEFRTIMGKSSARSRLHPISLEEQVFSDLKQQIKFNLITRLDVSQELINPALEEPMTVSPEEIRASIMHFRLADGVKPKSELASTEVWTLIVDTLINSGLYQGYDINSLIEYVASLGGAHYLERFRLPPAGPAAGAIPGPGAPDAGASPSPAAPAQAAPATPQAAPSAPGG